jgi:hypothetical protein
MICQNTRKFLSVMLSFMLVTASSQRLYGYQTAASPPPADSGNPTDPAPQSAAELQSLVAPIALYPDVLVAQILTASTFPDQIAIANYWMQQNKSLTGSALMQAVNKQLVGCERQGTHRISISPQQPVAQSHLDVVIGRGLSRPAV